MGIICSNARSLRPTKIETIKPRCDSCNEPTDAPTKGGTRICSACYDKAVDLLVKRLHI